MPVSLKPFLFEMIYRESLLVMMTEYDPFLRVPELKELCLDKCEIAQLECILDCNNDVNCISDCIRHATDCIEGNATDRDFWFKPGFQAEISSFQFSLRLSM